MLASSWLLTTSALRPQDHRCHQPTRQLPICGRPHGPPAATGKLTGHATSSKQRGSSRAASACRRLRTQKRPGYRLPPPKCATSFGCLGRSEPERSPGQSGMGSRWFNIALASSCRRPPIVRRDRAGTRAPALAPAVPKMRATGGDALALHYSRMTDRPTIRLTLRSICLVRSELLAERPASPSATAFPRRSASGSMRRSRQRPRGSIDVWSRLTAGSSAGRRRRSAARSRR